MGKDTVEMDPSSSCTWEGRLIKLAWQGSLLTMKFVSCLGDSGNRIVWSHKGSVTAETDATPFQELSRKRKGGITESHGQKGREDSRIQLFNL